MIKLIIFINYNIKIMSIYKFLLYISQISQLFKLGSQCYEDMKQFSYAIEEALFRLSVHRDRALTYKTEEVQITVVDELYVEQSSEGHVDKQIARVRLFFLGFLSGRFSSKITNTCVYDNVFFSSHKLRNDNSSFIIFSHSDLIYLQMFDLFFRYARRRIRNK